MNLKTKAVGLVAAFALVLGAAAPASAATTSELIDLLVSMGIISADQVAVVNAAVGGSTSSDSCGLKTAADMTLGSTGANVTELQMMLADGGYLVMPAGVAYGYFGGLTQSALASYQTAMGISPAAGYFGPVTKASIVCETSTTGGSTGGSTSVSGLGDGEASLESFELNDDEDEVAEGESEVVAVVEFDVEDGDVKVQRLDLTFATTSAEEDEPWDAFDEIRLLVDGDEIASEDVSDEDDWLDEDGPFVFRFSGLNYVVMDGDTAEIEIEVTAADSVDGADNDDAEWTIYVADLDIRAVDGEGIDQYIGDDDESVTFDIVAEGEGDELDLESSDDEILEDTIILDTDDSVEAPIFSFVLSADDSDNDIEINEIEIDVEISSTTGAIEDLVKDFYIEIDGERFDAENYSDDDDTTTLTFDVDGDVVIDAEDEVEVVLYAEFEEMESDSDYQGVTITASLDTDQIEAEGRDDIDTIGGDDQDGEEQTLRSVGIEVDLASKSAKSTGTDNTVGEFTFDIDIAAFDEAAWVELSASDATSTTNVGFTVLILDGNNNVVTTGTTTFALDSDKSASSNDRVKVASGRTESFDLTVFFDAATAGSYKALLYSVNFNDTDADGDSVETLTPQTDYRTKATYVETN